LKIYKFSTLDELTEIDKSQPIFVDTETGGEAYEFVVTIQVYQEHWDQVKVFVMKDLPSFAVEFIWASIKDSEMVGHNYGYDLMQFWRHANGTYETPANWFDTFYASRLAFPKWQVYSLDECLTKVLGYDPYDREGLVKKDMQKSFSPNTEITEDQGMYASIDVYLLPKLYHAVKAFRNDFNFKLDSRIAEYATLMPEMGMPVDPERLLKLEKDDNAEVIRLTSVLPEGLNVNSYIQVRKALGLKNTSDEVTLRIIASRPAQMEGIKGTLAKTTKRAEQRNVVLEPHYVPAEWKRTMADDILLKRKALKRLQFVVRAKKYMNEDHRITSRFSPHAITGRVQGSEENLSQYPRTMKQMWGINPKVHGDRVLVYADYSQLELRSICAILPERNMEEAYRNGIDLHTYASRNLTLDESKLPDGVTPRFVAKQLNFLALYGGGVANFQKTVCKLSEIWLETDVCQKAFRDWKTGFSDIKDWHEDNAKSPDNMDQTISGRKYKAKSYTDLNNIRNQGSGAEVAKLAWHYLYKYDMLGEDSWMVNMIHDAFIIDCPNIPEVYERVARNLGLAMQKAWFAIMKQAPIKDLPMPVDVLVGLNWEDIEYGNNIIYETTIEGMYMYDKELADVS